MPYGARRILKFDPVRWIAISDGKNFGEKERKFYGTVMWADGWIYGIPDNWNQIMKMNPNDKHRIVNVGEPFSGPFKCQQGVLNKEDGYIYYAASYETTTTNETTILKIDARIHNNESSPPHPNGQFGQYEWVGHLQTSSIELSCPIIGADSNIYWPP